MALPDDYIEALGAVGEAFAAYEAATGGVAILVGGSAAAILTEGAFMTGDFDVIAGDDIALDDAMRAAGFEHDPAGVHGSGGWFHPSHPRYGVEQVSGRYFDGRGDRDRCLKVTVRDGSQIVLPAIEDMIADRLGQHAASSGDTAMLEQAKALYAISDGLDIDYLIRRIVEETGNPALLGLSKD
ncbi:hypothetical protein KUV75_09480 [Qipengyuania gaetbuli]|uniref:hypothetical protein n=1 Tax=Qipengyuania gaetbuli TaxID=266952 RepID=UPI001C98F492|nr:hypothetical protein [Qipengyuania gaetbuli]MBY6015128.1 hypothetical protein [Qipengyuania gaetbuli]